MHWSYEGNTGPRQWGELAPEFAACRLGHRQSPIDIMNPRTAELDALRFELQPSPLHIANTGHGIQVDCPPASFLSVGSDRYQLLQFHFHRPGEHRINGQRFALEAHAVFADTGGRMAVTAILFRETADAPPHPLLQNLWPQLPGRAGEERSPEGVIVNPADLLPTGLGYYSYDGSLTTPPCTEGVRWFVLREAATATPEQIARFAALYPHNARPIQPLNGREVLTGAD